MKLDFRIFSDKQLLEKAQRWAVEIKRAGNGGRLKSDSIPGDLDKAKALAGKLFTPEDAAVFIPALVGAMG
jgi:hypothetical protein